ncbi:MAG: helix-turn-helix domain-containing protein [Pseudonocardiaceae bacterium]
MAEDTFHVGAAIRTLRIAAGLTQTALATRANVSVSLLSKVECADRAATSALMTAVARALRVPVERLTGQPYADDQRDQQIHRDVGALREALRHWDLPADQPARPLSELTADVTDIGRVGRNADYRKLAARLPGLIEELTVAAHQAAPSSAETVYGLLVLVFRQTHALLLRLGYPDLAESVEHKLALAAERSGDPLAGALVYKVRQQSLKEAGDDVYGLRLMDIARAELADEMRRPTPAALTVYGLMHLSSAYMASRTGDAAGTRDHLAAAQELTIRLGTGDQVHYGVTFGPATAVTYQVGTHVELGDAAAALTAAELWAPSSTLPRARQGYHHLNVARARLLHGDRSGSLQALQQARQIAPQQTRLNPVVRDLTAVLVSLHRRANPELTSFANWLGLAR